MPQIVIVQKVNGITTTFVKTVITNVMFVILVLPIVVGKVNVPKTESVHQHVIVILDSMMTDITQNVMSVIVNVLLVQKLDVFHVQDTELEPLIVIVQPGISKRLL